MLGYFTFFWYFGIIIVILILEIKYRKNKKLEIYSIQKIKDKFDQYRNFFLLMGSLSIWIICIIIASHETSIPFLIHNQKLIPKSLIFIIIMNWFVTITMPILVNLFCIKNLKEIK